MKESTISYSHRVVKSRKGRGTCLKKNTFVIQITGNKHIYVTCEEEKNA